MTGTGSRRDFLYDVPCKTAAEGGSNSCCSGRGNGCSSCCRRGYMNAECCPCSKFTDTDSDGIMDLTDPDSDGDGIPDAEEGTGDSDSNGVPDYLDAPGDADSDGVPDAEEGTGDSDGDGLPDAAEGTGDSDSDGIPDALDSDSGPPGAISAFCGEGTEASGGKCEIKCDRRLQESVPEVASAADIIGGFLSTNPHYAAKLDAGHIKIMTELGQRFGLPALA